DNLLEDVLGHGPLVARESIVRTEHALRVAMIGRLDGDQPRVLAGIGHRRSLKEGAHIGNKVARNGLIMPLWPQRGLRRPPKPRGIRGGSPSWRRAPRCPVRAP